MKRRGGFAIFRLCIEKLQTSQDFVARNPAQFLAFAQRQTPLELR
jgi:hypothetical protein